MAVQSVTRAANILKLFSRSRRSFKLSEIAAELNLNTPTVHGLVSTLEQAGFLSQDPRTREYLLGTSLYELGAYFAARLDINIHASGHIHRLAQRTNATARIGIWDNDTVLITLFAFPEAGVNSVDNFAPRIFRIMPYCTALGKAIMAYLSKEELQNYLAKGNREKLTKNTLTTSDEILAELEIIRESGYAINRGELSPGRAAIAAPIWGAGKKLEGAVSIPVKTVELNEENINQLTNEVIHTAMEISQSMGYLLGGPVA